MTPVRTTTGRRSGATTRWASTVTPMMTAEITEEIPR